MLTHNVTEQNDVTLTNSSRGARAVYWSIWIHTLKAQAVSLYDHVIGIIAVF